MLTQFMCSNLLRSLVPGIFKRLAANTKSLIGTKPRYDPFFILIQMSHSPTIGMKPFQNEFGGGLSVGIRLEHWCRA